jgi:hypothetical protein
LRNAGYRPYCGIFCQRPPFNQGRCETYVQAWAEYDDTQRVEVADNIVGNAISSKHGCQKVGRAADSIACSVSTIPSLIKDVRIGLPVVVPILHREEAEHASRLHSPLDILDELITVASLRL